MKSKLIKRIECSVETPDMYSMIGVWGFSYEHIRRKLDRLEKYGVYVDGVVPMREVDKFSDTVTWRV